MLKLDLKPKPRNSFEVTKGKIIATLLIFIALFASYKTYAYSRMANELFYLTTENSLAEIKDYSDKAALDSKFSKDDYCGWEVVKDGETTRSENYLKRRSSTPVFTYENKIKDDKNETGGKISVCMKKITMNNDSANRNIFGILLVIGIIYILVRKEEEVVID